MGWPLTNGSGGSWNSLGVMSCCELVREEVVREARVLARVLKMLVLGELEGGGIEGDGRGSEFGRGDIGAELSD